MEIIPVLFFLVFVAFVFVKVFGLVRGHGNWTRAFEQIATRYGGWYSSARTSRPPAATFKYKNADVRVKCRRPKRVRGGPETEFRIRWQSHGFRMEILSDGLLPRFRRLKSVTASTTGDEKFDSQFSVFVEADRKDQIDSMISNGVRWQVSQLETFLNSVPVRVSLEKGWLYVRKLCFIKDAQMLDDFVRFCLELFDQFQLTQSEGIDFRDDMVLSAVDEVRCPICGSDIEGKMVICVRCKTPHCLDCWQYNVKCGMYACDESRYLVVGGD